MISGREHTMARNTRGRRTDYEWIGGIASHTEASSGSTAAAIVTVNIPGTLMCIRGNLLVSLDGPTDNDKVMSAAGLILVSEEQLAVGASAIPNSADINDMDADWIWHQWMPMLSQAVVATQMDETYFRAVIDSKAMRRVKPTQTLVMRTANIAQAGTPGLDYSLGCRVLFGS